MPRTLVSPSMPLRNRQTSTPITERTTSTKAVALIRGDAAFLEVTLVRVAICHAPARDRLDATHDDGLEVQELDTHALVDLERDARRIGTVRHQTRGGMKRCSIGVLILKTTGVGDQTAQQAGGDAVACGNTAIGQKSGR